MGEALDRLEAGDGAAGAGVVELDPAAQQEEHGEQDQGADQQPAAVGGQRALAEFVPAHAAVLDQHFLDIAAGGDGDVGGAVAQGAPELGVGGAAPGAELVGDGRGAVGVSGGVAAEAVVDLFAALAGEDVFEGLGPAGGRAVGRLRGGAVLRRGGQGEGEHQE